MKGDVPDVWHQKYDLNYVAGVTNTHAKYQSQSNLGIAQLVFLFGHKRPLSTCVLSVRKSDFEREPHHGSID